MIIIVAIVCLAAGFFAGLVTAAMCTSGAVEDAYREGVARGRRGGPHAPD